MEKEIQSKIQVSSRENAGGSYNNDSALAKTRGRFCFREIYQQTKPGKNKEKERDSPFYPEALPFLISSSR
jgi:hypothetical protein